MNIKNILIFLGAFVLVTAGLIFLNTMFKNIFRFDFTPVGENIVSQDSSETSKKVNDKNNLQPSDIVVEDSTQNNDTLSLLSTYEKTELAKKPGESENVKQGLPEIINKLQPVNETEELIPEVINNVRVANQTDSTYTKWLKDTAQMFEAMEPKKAAKIIINYPDENARDIMYKMKKKKAAEILAELDPVSANRITRYRGETE